MALVSLRATCLCLLLATWSDSQAAGPDNPNPPPSSGVTAETLAIIVNENDALSRAIARYYQERRRIPHANLIRVRFAPGKPVMSEPDFRKLRAEVVKRTPAHIQAYVITWAAPYRVECMSITTALASGFDRGFCSSLCGRTRPSPYFNSDSRSPHTDHDLRPAMVLASTSLEDTKKLIDRGLAADASFPRGTGYLVSTPDKARNVRATFFPDILRTMGKKLDLQVVQADDIRNRDDVLLYFTGASQVRGLETLRFRPGAVADHLTSSGGQLNGSDQMSSLRWLEAGATGSYGTVVEPCNLLDKFPSPGILIKHYLRGDSLIEAYWKSVAMPGQGIFVGEPLAAPFRHHATGSMAR